MYIQNAAMCDTYTLCKRNYIQNTKAYHLTAAEQIPKFIIHF